MGAMPVPGPIIMIGVVMDCGSRNEEARINTRQVFPAFTNLGLLSFYYEIMGGELEDKVQY